MTAMGISRLDRSIPSRYRPHAAPTLTPAEGGFRSHVPGSTERLSVGEVYDRLHFAQRRSATLKRVWLHASGPDYPAAFDHLSFLTLAELQRAAAELRLGPGQTLVDLACGTGGPGLWIAHEAGIRVIGIDVSETALAEARSRAQQLNLHDRADYRRSSFEQTGLPEASVDGAFSVDALVYASDTAAAMQEIARILRPSARFVGTTFEVDLKVASALGLPAPSALEDYRPTLEAAGFRIVAYEETSGWAERLRATYRALRAEKEPLVADTGETAFKVLLAELARGAEDKLTKRRVFITAERR
jgi:SAM-dependent methyltransferase